MHDVYKVRCKCHVIIVGFLLHNAPVKVNPEPHPGICGALLSPYWQLFESPVCGGFARFFTFRGALVGDSFKPRWRRSFPQGLLGTFRHIEEDTSVHRSAFHSTKISRNSGSKSNGTEIFGNSFRKFRFTSRDCSFFWKFGNSGNFLFHLALACVAGGIVGPREIKLAASLSS